VKIDDILYFAPKVRFDDLDFVGHELPQQFAARINGYYLDAAEHCGHSGFAFAAGVLVLAAIDALARVQIGGAVGSRFKSFAAHELGSFSKAETAAKLYDDFRNGLIHEARIKQGAQFSLQSGQTIAEADGVVIVNPLLLSSEVRGALERYVRKLNREPKLLSDLRNRLMQDHADDV